VGDTSRLPRAPTIKLLLAPRGGYVEQTDAPVATPPEVRQVIRA
jgi:hypothetical protein